MPAGAASASERASISAFRAFWRPFSPPLAQAGIGIFAISTFSTDYVLVKAGDTQGAAAALREAGHTVDHEI